MAGAPDTYEHWAAVKRAMAKQRFVDAYPHPFLVRRGAPSSTGSFRALGAAPVSDSTGAFRALTGNSDDWTEKVSFETGVMDFGSLSPAPAKPDAATSRLRGARVVPIVKAPGNPFPDRISIGRAQNCDIVFRDASVSKLHAHFRMLDYGKVEIVDVRSSNGTRLNGTPLIPLRPLAVESGDVLAFGGVTVQYLVADKLWDQL